MPSKSQAQHDFMEKCYRDKEFREKHKVSKQVAKEYLDADKKAGLWQTKKPPAKTTNRKKRVSKESLPFFNDW